MAVAAGFIWPLFKGQSQGVKRLLFQHLRRTATHTQSQCMLTKPPNFRFLRWGTQSCAKVKLEKRRGNGIAISSKSQWGRYFSTIDKLFGVSLLLCFSCPNTHPYCSRAREANFTQNLARNTQVLCQQLTLAPSAHVHTNPVAPLWHSFPLCCCKPALLSFPNPGPV